jgi:hypothetical protein
VAISDLANLEPSPARKGPSCTVCQALEQIDPDEAAGLRSLLANPRWRYSEIADRIAADPDTPLEIPHQTLARHAKGHCAARERLR